MPSHHHVLISCFRWPIFNSSITKGNFCCREKKIQTKPGLVEPPSPLCVKGLGGRCRPPLVSFVYMSACWWELTGKLPSDQRDLQCRCLLEEKYDRWQVVVLKETESLVEKFGLSKERF